MPRYILTDLCSEIPQIYKTQRYRNNELSLRFELNSKYTGPGAYYYIALLSLELPQVVDHA